MTPLQIGPLPGPSAGLEIQLIVTAGLLIAFAMIGWVARRVRKRVEFEAESVERTLNAGMTAAFLMLAFVIVYTILGVWDVSVFEFLGIEDPLVVLTRGVLTLIMFLGAYVLSGVLQRFVYELTDEQTAITRHQTELVFRSTQVGLYVLAAIVVFSVWSINIGGLLVGAGFLGIVIGLAAQQTIGALIAGFVLMFSRPFEIGDWVEIGNREGIVTEISIVNTRIQTFDGEYAMLPNDTVGSQEIINRTRKGRLRIHVEVGVDYDTDVEHAAAVAREAMRDVDEILTVPQPQVVLSEFGNSAIVLDLRFWIDKPSARRRARSQTAVIAAVKSAFDSEGIKIPFPQRELSGRAETGGFHIADQEEIPVEPDTDISEDG